MAFKDLFALICHQRKDRSYVICGKGMYLCARCTGIFTGFLTTFALLFFLYGFFNARAYILRVLIYFFIPLALDGITQFLGLRRSNNTLRLFTGYLFGMGSAFLIYFAFTLALHHAYAAVLPSWWSLSSLAFLFLFWGVLDAFDKKCNKFVDNFFKALIIVGVPSLLIIGLLAFFALCTL